MVTLSSYVIWLVLSFRWTNMTIKCVFALPSRPSMDLQKMAILAEKNHLFSKAHFDLGLYVHTVRTLVNITAVAESNPEAPSTSMWLYASKKPWSSKYRIATYIYSWMLRIVMSSALGGVQDRLKDTSLMYSGLKSQDWSPRPDIKTKYEKYFVGYFLSADFWQTL